MVITVGYKNSMYSWLKLANWFWSTFLKSLFRYFVNIIDISLEKGGALCTNLNQRMLSDRFSYNKPSGSGEKFFTL